MDLTQLKAPHLHCPPGCFLKLLHGQGKAGSPTGALQPGKQALLFLACCCAEPRSGMKRGFISNEGRGAGAPGGNI